MMQIQLAIELIELGARLQVLESETDLSSGRLIRLYKEVRGVSPPKGMLPFSTDWFMTWLPNIHSSLFYNLYSGLIATGCERMEAFVKAFRLYLEHLEEGEEGAVLGLTRAWTLVRFFESGMLEQVPCTVCGGHFVTHAHGVIRNSYVCGLCQPPSRAGKTRRRKEQEAEAAKNKETPSAGTQCSLGSTERNC